MQSCQIRTSSKAFSNMSKSKKTTIPSTAVISAEFRLPFWLFLSWFLQYINKLLCWYQGQPNADFAWKILPINRSMQAQKCQITNYWSSQTYSQLCIKVTISFHRRYFITHLFTTQTCLPATSSWGSRQPSS